MNTVNKNYQKPENNKYQTEDFEKIMSELKTSKSKQNSMFVGDK